MPMPVRELMRVINRAKILEAIRTACMISRVDLSRATGLSRASITGLTADLIDEGLIIEKKAGEYEGGRRPMLLGLNPSGAYAVGVNLSLSEVNAVIINFNGDVMASHTHSLKSSRYSVEEIAERIISAVQACIWEANFSRDRISGVGIGIPGMVDAESGIIRFLPNYGWENVNLRGKVFEGLNHPCYIDNDANTLTLAEQWFGEGRGVDNFLVVTIETGVGAGAVINGRLYRGSEGIANEFGHVTIDPQGLLCRCGKKGCLETYAGKIGILRNARHLAEIGKWQAKEPDNITFEEFIDAAQNGDADLCDLFAEAGRALGIGLSHLITLYNPSSVIITGKGVQAGSLIFDTMHTTLENCTSDKFGRSRPSVIIREWAVQDWARGAGTLVLQELFKSPAGQMAADR